MRLTKFFLNIIVAAVIFMGCGKETIKPITPYNPGAVDSTFSNPLMSSGPDPWIIKKDSFYYYMHTLGKRIGIWKTKSVGELGTAEYKTVWSAPSSGAFAENVWAPELHFLNNKWYLYFTAGYGDLSTQRMFVLENPSADPMQGDWTNLGQVSDPAANFFAIDATILEHNNKTYILYSGHPSSTDNTQNIYIAQMSSPGSLQSSRVLISQPTYNWEMFGAPPAVNEGPQILKNPAGKVFVVFSASGCWSDDYSLGMLTLKDNGDPLNPSDWTKTPTPVFTKMPGNNAFGPGHNAFFKSQDGKEDWIIYHANSFAGQGCGDARNPRMQKFTWNTDGTPNFGVPVKTGVEMRKPSGEF